MRKIGFVVSIALHMGLILWLFNTSLPFANLEIEETVIKAKPAKPIELVFYKPLKPSAPKTEIVFSDTGKKIIPVPPAERKDSPVKEVLQNRKQSLSLMAPSVSIARPKIIRDLQHMPNFLILGGKEPLIPNPFAQNVPGKEPDLSEYIPSVADLYNDTKISQILAIGPSGVNPDDPNAKKNRELYKGKQGRIDFNVQGLDIRPWARKVVNKIQQQWQLPANLIAVTNISLRVGIKITVEKSGSLSSIEVNEPSYLKEYDQAVLSALNACAPFPSLPVEFPDENLIAFLHFNVSDHE
jgi:TonB family protein